MDAAMALLTSRTRAFPGPPPQSQAAPLVSPRVVFVAQRCNQAVLELRIPTWKRLRSCQRPLHPYSKPPPTLRH
eukprot:3887183-Karenia_brevis.AAC.1